MPDNFVPVIGLEVHVELKTMSKMFCSCPAEHFGKTPNTQVCPVCLGLPGALPVPNEQAIEWTQLFGKALGCRLNTVSQFDRKHYFYPDLTKGYQISQYEYPLVKDGVWKLEDGRVIRIRRIHLEEDTGKLIHQTVKGKKVSLVDYNRSGVPLLELVTEPDFTSVAEAREFLQELQRIIRYLGISDADMEKGSMRLEANVSVRDKREATSDKLPEYRVEVKNINSFRFLEKAIDYETERQALALKRGEKLFQETRGFDEPTGTTKLQRSKEEAQDYRYFPEPDIPEFKFNSEELDKIKESVPELPRAKKERLVRDFGLSAQYAQILTQTRILADYFEEAVKVGGEYKLGPKRIADVLVNKKPDIKEILPARLVAELRMKEQKVGVEEEKLREIIEQVIAENNKTVEDYKKGKENALQFLIGQVMAKTKGRADASKAAGIIKEKLDA